MKKENFKKLIRHLRQENAEMHAKINDIALHTNNYPHSLEQINTKVDDITKKNKEIETKIDHQSRFLEDIDRSIFSSLYRSESETLRLLNVNQNVLNDYIKKGLLTVKSNGSQTFYAMEQIQYILYNLKTT